MPHAPIPTRRAPCGCTFYTGGAMVGRLARPCPDARNPGLRAARFHVELARQRLYVYAYEADRMERHDAAER